MERVHQADALADLGQDLSDYRHTTEVRHGAGRNGAGNGFPGAVVALLDHAVVVLLLDRR